jgi:hypothetical protein
MDKWLIILAGLITLIGYWGPWVNHAVAGLVITGVDLGEYVKFLPAIRGNELRLWREGYYLPLLTVSLSLSLAAFRFGGRDRWPYRIIALGGALIATLNLLPPAWTPARMITAEFQQQTSWLLICLASAAVSPFLALLPARLIVLINGLLTIAALWYPTRNFLRILPELAPLYGHSVQPSWGFYLTNIGLLLLCASLIWVLRPRTD